MTRVLLPLLLYTFLSTCAHAQTLPITYEKQLIGYRFKYDNLRLQAPNFRNAMALDPEASAALRGAGLMELGGVVLVSYGGAVAVTALFVENDNGDKLSGRGYYVAGGLASAALGAWLLDLTGKKRVRAADVYNANLPDQPTTYVPVIEPSVTGNGLGVSLRF